MPARRLPLAPSNGAPRALPLAEGRASDAVHRPFFCVWEITLRCDLSCKHCGSRAGHAREGELSTDECLGVVRQLADLGVREVALIGGEAYLRDDWLTIAEAITARGMDCTMVTGGRGMTPARAAGAKAAGVRFVSVSLDGTEAEHDALRGLRGSHAAALEAMRALREAGVRFGVNAQVNARNLTSLLAVVEQAMDAGARTFKPILTVPMGRTADDPELLLQPYDLLVAFPLLAEAKARCDARGVLFSLGNNLGYFGPYETTFRGGTRLGHSGGCGAGRVTIGIEADGSIKGCPSLPSDAYTGGNVREHTLEAIWERAPALRYTRDRTVDDLWGYCRTCYYAEDCMAGCTWTSHVTLGRPGNNPYCHHRALEMQRAGKRERVVRVEAPPGDPFDYGRFELLVEDDPMRSDVTRIEENIE